LRIQMGKQSNKASSANKATQKLVRIAPQKVRLVVDLIRGKGVDEALNILQFTAKRAAPVVSKLVENAMNNIERSDAFDWDIDDLYVSEVYVDEGPTLRRFKPRAQGRATRINKRTSHITVVLESRKADA